MNTQARVYKEPGGAREVLDMAWPIAVGMLSFTLMGVVDTLLMGRVGTAPQAGVGLATTLGFVFVGFFRGVLSGAQALVAAGDGAGDRVRVARAGGAGILLGAVSGVIAGLALAGVGAWVLPWVVDDAGIRSAAQAYIGLSAWALPFHVLAFGLLAGLQGLGDSKSRMYVSLAANAVNTTLDLLLIPRYGAEGAAAATLAASAATALLYGWRFRARFPAPERPTREVLQSTLTIGLPAGLQSLAGVLAFLVMELILARSGPAHLAASGIITRIASVSFLPGLGIGEAAGVLVGRSLGRGQAELASRAIRSARGLALAVMGAWGVVFWLRGAWLASFFSADPEVLALAARLMIVVASFQLLDALALVHLSALRGAGDSRFTLALTLVTSWGVMVPLCFVLGWWLELGAIGTWLGLTVEIGVLAGVSWWRVRGLARGRVGRLDLLLGEPAPAVG